MCGRTGICTVMGKAIQLFAPAALTAITSIFQWCLPVVLATGQNVHHRKGVGRWGEALSSQWTTGLTSLAEVRQVSCVLLEQDLASPSPTGVPKSPIPVGGTMMGGSVHPCEARCWTCDDLVLLLGVRCRRGRCEIGFSRALLERWVYTAASCGHPPLWSLPCPFTLESSARSVTSMEELLSNAP